MYIFSICIYQHYFTNPWFQFILATPVQFIIGWQFYVGAQKFKEMVAPIWMYLLLLVQYAAYFTMIYEMVRWLNGSTTQPHLYFETSAVLIVILFGKYLEARGEVSNNQCAWRIIKFTS